MKKHPDAIKAKVLTARQKQDARTECAALLAEHKYQQALDMALECQFKVLEARIREVMTKHPLEPTRELRKMSA